MFVCFFVASLNVAKQNQSINNPPINDKFKQIKSQKIIFRRKKYKLINRWRKFKQLKIWMKYSNKKKKVNKKISFYNTKAFKTFQHVCMASRGNYSALHVLEILSIAILVFVNIIIKFQLQRRYILTWFGSKFSICF